MVSPRSSSEPPERFLSRRRARLERLLARPVERPEGSALAPQRRSFLREEAEELYWNELSWEKLTAEELARGSIVVELAFPGFLAFIDGLLLREAGPDSPVPASPRPEVVEDVLLFLSGRCVDLEAGDDEEEGAMERELTLRLMDLVLYRLHGLDGEDVERLELARLAGDE